MFIFGCNYNCIIGSDNEISEDRSVSSFSSVSLDGSGNIYITQDGTTSVRVETDDNIMPNVITKVFGDKLTISTKQCYTGEVDVYLTMNEIKDLTISGSGKIIGETPIKTDELKLKISGSGLYNIDVEANKVETLIEGSGKLYLKGKTDNFNHKVSGSGNLFAYDLDANSVKIGIYGSGNSQVTANNILDATIMGSGNVNYKGTPKVSFDGSGSGKLRSAE